MNAWMSRLPTGSPDILKKNRGYLPSIEPILTFCRISALAPFVITKDKLGRFTIEHSRMTEIYACVFVVFVYGASFYECVVLHFKNNSKIASCYYFGRLLVSTLTHISCLQNRDLILTGFKLTAEFGFALNKRLMVLPIITTTVVIITFTVSSFTKLPMLDATLFSIVFCVPFLTMVVICAQSGVQTVAMRKAIEELNQQLQSILERKTDGRTSLTMVMVQHDKIWKLCTVLNTAYAKPMVLATSAVFCEVTFCFYYFCSSIKSETTPYVLFATIAWTALQIIPPYCAAIICQHVENASEQTRLICKGKRPSRFHFFLKYNVDELGELELQLQQQQVRFSACGFFYINNSHITTVVSTVFTYTVILLQTMSGSKALE